ncbi:MAG: binding-protein-dependent transport system inner rane component [Paenibacillus sp.]|nr:binding-protein-dependent transport system inner rane component [Paenibacillus sp.]
MNTIIRMVVGTAIQLTLTVLVAYPLSRKNLPHRGLITMIFVFTMFFSGGLIPEYLLIRQYLHLGNTIWALVLPSAINTFSMLIVRNYMMGIPIELEESAKIDGAGDLRILWRIMLPLTLPILVTIGLWALVWHWNQWFDALIYLDNGKSFPLQMVLRKIVMDSSPIFTDLSLESNQYNVTPETVKAATIIVSTLPIMLIYPFIQKYFIQGVMIGSVKG